MLNWPAVATLRRAWPFGYRVLAPGNWAVGTTQKAALHEDVLSLSGTALISLSFALFTLIAAQFMLGYVSEDTGGGPLFMIGAQALIGGVIVFGAAEVKAKFYPI